MALSGGLVAGIRAGLAYNSFPLMNGHIVPPEIMLLVIAVPLYWWRVRATASLPYAARIGADLLLAILVVQATLGIGTLLLVVPPPLAVAHQATAVLLFAVALNAAHALR